MMARQMVVILAFALSLHVTETADIAIGGIFGKDEIEEKLAFSQEIKKGALEFNLKTQIIETDMGNDFTLGTAICKLRQQGVFAFFASHTNNAVNSITSFSSNFELPVVTSSFATASTRGKKSFDFYVRPNYAKAIVDVIKQRYWTKMLYIFDTDEGLEQLQQLMDALRTDGFSADVQMRRVAGPNDAFSIVQEQQSKNPPLTNFLIHMKPNALEILLSKQTAYNSQTYAYFFVVNMVMEEIALHSLTTRSCTERHNTVFGFTMGNRNTITTEKGIDTNTALAIDAASVLRTTFRKLYNTNPQLTRATTTPTPPANGYSICDEDVVQKWQHGSTIATAIRETKIEGLTGNIEFDEAGLRANYSLNLLTVVTCDPQWSTFQQHYWRSSVRVPPSLSRKSGTQSVSNKTYIVTSIMAPPFLMLRKETGGVPYTGNDRYEGYCADLANKIAEIVGFKYEIVLVKDGKYGSSQDDGSWNGMMGEIIRHEADLAIAPLTITAHRERDVDFSKAFMSLGISLMMKKPTREYPGLFQVFSPLSYEIWISVIFAYIGVSMMQYLVGRISTVGWHVRDEYIPPDNLTLLNSFWYTMTGLLRQGCKHHPRSVSGRCVSGLWCIFALIIALSYFSNLFPL